MKKGTIKTNLSAFLFFVMGVCSSQNKIIRTIRYDKGDEISFKSTYSDVVFKEWDSNTVQVEVIANGKPLESPSLKHKLKAPLINVTDGKINIVIDNSPQSTAHVEQAKAHELLSKKGLIALSKVLENVSEEQLISASVSNFNLPEIIKLPKHPDIPRLYVDASKIPFDYEAYKAKAQEYITEWVDNFQNLYGKKHAKNMKMWGKQFGQSILDNNEIDDEDLKRWAVQYGKQVGDRYPNELMAWAKKLANRLKDYKASLEAKPKLTTEKELEGVKKIIRAEIEKHRAVFYAKFHANFVRQSRKDASKRKQVRVLFKKDQNKKLASNFNKSVIVKFPKQARLNINMKYGSLTCANNMENANITLAYTKFDADAIKGNKTIIHAAYAPVIVKTWGSGTLNLEHVHSATLQNIEHLVLKSNYSNIYLNDIHNTLDMDINVGDVEILNIAPSFSNLNAKLKHAKMELLLPKIIHNFDYKGAYSQLIHPKNLNNNRVTTLHIVSPNHTKAIVVNGIYSKIITR